MINWNTNAKCWLMKFLHYDQIENSGSSNAQERETRIQNSPSRIESREAKSGGSYRIRICDLIHVKDAL